MFRYCKNHSLQILLQLMICLLRNYSKNLLSDPNIFQLYMQYKWRPMSALRNIRRHNDRHVAVRCYYKLVVVP